MVDVPDCPNNCDRGFVCKDHVQARQGHDGCRVAGTVCQDPRCPYWQSDPAVNDAAPSGFPRAMMRRFPPAAVVAVDAQVAGEAKRSALRFREQLGRQLSFIANSCALFDRGCTDEAIRVATSLRVLFHDTKFSKSLLTHLDAWSIQLISSCSIRDIDPERNEFFEGLISNRGGRWRPKLGEGRRSTLPAKEWWEQVVTALGRKMHLTRRVIALTAADKDGGAHVDEELPDDYQNLIDGVWLDMSTGQLVPDHHLLYIRQMGHEVLRSPDLRALTV